MTTPAELIAQADAIELVPLADGECPVQRQGRITALREQAKALCAGRTERCPSALYCSANCAGRRGGGQ